MTHPYYDAALLYDWRAFKKRKAVHGQVHRKKASLTFYFMMFQFIPFWLWYRNPLKLAPVKKSNLLLVPAGLLFPLIPRLTF